ncbi:MAG: protein kinase [Candidatus Aminicenantes bacterium]|nr:protein kinase [Candidatus Aminicenantes bacterium]
MAVKCPKCHTENTSDSQFCKKCATPFPSPEEIPASPTKTLETPKEEFTRGTTFASRYELIEELGKGGMGKVYRVFDKKIKEEVALKLLKPEISGDKKTIERFTNELKFSRKIVHKNVCRMYDLNEEDGTHYITMEYVPGEDLKMFIHRSGQLTIGKSISIARQVCEGLAEAHSAGVVHRDLKPGNIMIDKDGNARIMDFGIARSLKTEGITGEGVIIGTPAYMSPEQVEGKEADQRSDIYSSGVMLYEMMTGRVPFEGDTSLSIALKHKTEIPKDPREVNAQIPENISRLILRCMEKKKEDRYQSVNELLDELKQVKVDETDVKERGRWFKSIFIRKREKERPPQKLTKKILKYSLRALALLLIVYVVISIISLINDYVYGVKLDKIKVERETYFKNLFPIQKDWLPEEWVTRNCNACNNYLKLFPPKINEEGQEIPEKEYLKNEYVKQIIDNPLSAKLTKVFYDFEYSNIQELKTFTENYGKHYKFDELFDAVKCSKLNPYQMMIENDRFLNFYLLMKYPRMIVLKARIDFLEGNYEEGLMKIYNTMIFTLDLMLTSHSLIESLVAVACFKWLFKELMPLFLSDEIDFNLNIVKQLEKLTSLTLDKLEPELAYYKEYLYFGKFDEIFSSDLKSFNYYLFEKLLYWNHGFSGYRFLNVWAKFYQELFEDLKFIRNIRDKSVYTQDYFEKNVPEGPGISVANLPSAFFKYNLARLFGKVALIVLTHRKHGMNSLEFSDLKGTDFFINELSGKKFEIIFEGNEPFIVLDENYKLSLKKIDYKKDHREILKSFKHFDLESEDQIRSLFYSFELE